jgi:aminoglycoside phosphotransferase (APT) family kinase protein/tetratricopeptide (TPR) repeat protein
MPIAPRFRRVAALQRPFVDREQILADFDEELARAGLGCRVFNVTGVGGIGKSRLLRELEDRAAPHFRTAMIDLQVPALRRQDDALAVLRAQLGSQGAAFDRFDIAYAVLWQRLHPHMRLSKAELFFADYSAVLTGILDSASGLPVFGTALGLLKLLDQGSADVRRRFRIRHDPTLQALDALPNGELGDAVTYLFAEDLRAASSARKSVVIMDSYEALVPAPAYAGRVQLADAWLRDMAGQLDQAVVVIASREPLQWEISDPEWKRAIRTSVVSGLPMSARLDLLEAGGISGPAERQLIADASAGLPFYLHLAVDTHQQAGGGMDDALVSQDEILGRFLQHVAPEEIRSLEILSPARVFDYEIFRQLAAAFQLPGHRLAWDSLTAYSFIYPAGDGLRLHQLIRAAVQERLPGPAVTQIHALLNGLWGDRARQAAGTAAARAWREAAYHGLRAGQLTAAGLLGYADRAVRGGGHGAAAGVADDLQEWLASQPGGGSAGDAALALRCLRAEAAVRLGDAAAVIALTPGTPAAAVGADPIAARLAVAAGHGQRIAGHTRAALGIFTSVWDRADGPPKLAAGLWAADLHMCQGRFRDAEALAAELEALTPADEAEFRGDIARLRHLTRRFALDFGAARRHLDDATACYRAADSVLGLANACTNRAEFLALTSPAEAISEAGRAIEAQREIGAHHELGKAYSALAVAHLKLGELDRAETALQSAFSALDRAGYRSGRARAEFYLAIAQARRGRIDEAFSSLRRAVAELQDADVYPTLIVGAARALAILGTADDEVTAASVRAAGGIQPLGTPGELEARIGGFVRQLIGPGTWKPDEVYREAAALSDSAAGYYNHNVKLATPAGPVIVRMPIPGSDVMDLVIWPESSILRAIRDRVIHAPRLLCARESPPFQVLEFIDGELLDAIAPRGVPVPGHVIGDVAEVFGQLCAIPREAVPSLPGDWPADGQTADFARRLSAVTAGVYSRFRPEFGELFASLGIPADPLAPVLGRWAALRPRPFRLVHADVHRKNMMLAGGRTYVLDWELALWGDPVYDLAVHIHKMGYSPAEEAAARAAWLAAVPGDAADGWEPDLRTYLTHERVKSAIVDTVRYAKIITSGSASAERVAELTGKLAGKYRAAQATGGNWPARNLLEPEGILALIRHWDQRRPGHSSRA